MANNPLVYIILNGELNMSSGKAAAQSGHALATLVYEHGIETFTKATQRTILVLEARNQNQMENLVEYLTDLNIPVSKYIDEGVNEIAPYSLTAIASGQFFTDDVEYREIFKDLPLYGKRKKWYKLWQK